MQMSDVKPKGTVVGFVRLHKVFGAAYVQIVDVVKYKVAHSSFRFREENWIVTKDETKQSSLGRNTDNFSSEETADEYFAWWLKSKLDDQYTVLQVDGIPGPLPNSLVEESVKS